MRKTVFSVVAGVAVAALALSCSARPETGGSSSEPTGEQTTSSDESTTGGQEGSGSSGTTESTDESSAPPAGEPIVIGMTGPESGQNASLGEDYRDGMTLAIDEINADGGVLGRPLKLAVQDNACDPAQAVTAFGALAEQDNAAIVIGGVCSPATMAAMASAEKYGVVQLTVGATAAGITDGAGVGGNIWQFRMNVNDPIMAAAEAKLVADMGYKSVSIVASNDSWGKGVVETFSAEFAKNAVAVDATEYFLREGQADFRPMLTKLKSVGSPALLIAADYPDAAPIALQAQEVGYAPEQIFARGSMISPNFVDLTGDASLWSGSLGVDRWAPQGSDWEAEFAEQHDRQPSIFNALSYFGVYVAKAAIEAAGSADRTAIRDAMETLSVCLPDLGPVEFDDHNQAHPDAFFIELSDGKVVLNQRASTQDGQTACS